MRRKEGSTTESPPSAPNRVGLRAGAVRGASGAEVREQQRARALSPALPGTGQAADEAGPPPGAERLGARWAIEPD